MVYVGPRTREAVCTHIAVLLDAALLLGHDGDVREGRPTHPLHDGSHFVVDGRRYVAKSRHPLRLYTHRGGYCRGGVGKSLG